MTSNYPESGGGYPESGGYPEGGSPGGGATPYQPPQHQQYAEPQGGGFPAGGPYPGGGPQWSGQQQGGPTGYGERRGGRSFSGGSRNVQVRSTFKTTEFWVLVVVSIALLIAAAVTDQGADGQGFGAAQAWRYVTALAIGYMISRGLTKFGGHEDKDHDHGRGDR
jgi:hypothetical protein